MKSYKCWIVGGAKHLFPCRSYVTGRRTHYDVLGVPKNANIKEIKAAFYTLSKKYHPDVVGSNPESAKKFLEVKEAYDVLKDPSQRKTYDLQIGAGNFADHSSTAYGSNYQYPPNSGFGYQYQQRPRYKYNRDSEWWNKTNEEWSKEFQRTWEKMRNETHRREQELYKEWQKRTWEDHMKRRSDRWANNEKTNRSDSQWNGDWRRSEQYKQNQKALADLTRLLQVVVIVFMVVSAISYARTAINSREREKLFRDMSRSRYPVSDKELKNMKKMMETPPPPRPTSNIWDDFQKPSESYTSQQPPKSGNSNDDWRSKYSLD